MRFLYLKDLIKECGIKYGAEVPDVKIYTITQKLAECKPSSAFFAIVGAGNDGHTFASAAYEAGTRVFVLQKQISLPSDAVLLITENTEKAFALACAAYFAHPDREVKIIGITGTKGKTTVSALIGGMLSSLSFPCARIGTDGAYIGDEFTELENTTPDSYTLYSLLRKAADKGIHYAAIEVSSQSLFRNRVYGIKFFAVLFTNLSKDHIGVSEHPDFAHYASCKKRLFTSYGAEYAIVNADDSACEFMLGGVSCTDLRCSLYDGDFTAGEIKYSLGHGVPSCHFSVRHHGTVYNAESVLPGDFNVMNVLLAAAGVYVLCGKDICESLASLRNISVRGRCEFVPLSNGACGVIDYAHNGESLSKMLLLLREFSPSVLSCVFGSVGMRSYERRRDLALAAERFADRCIITSDNPGDEDAEDICREIRDNFEEGDAVTVICDREEAIKYAVETSVSGEIILLAGKGHETYQLYRGIKFSFDERLILKPYSSDNYQEHIKAIDFLGSV